LPAAGDVVEVRWPAGDAVRVDAGVGAGDVVGTHYDPLLAKLIAFGPDRAAALASMRAAVDATAVLGITTNRGFLRWLLERTDVNAGELDTQLIDREWQPPEEGTPDEVWAAAAEALATLSSANAPRTGFRLNQPRRLRVEIGDEVRPVALDGPAGIAWAADGEGVLLDADGNAVRARLTPGPTPDAALRHASHGATSANIVRAPMPGSILEVRVSTDDAVIAGQVLLVLEAMKMENTVAAPAAGHVKQVLVTPGQQVKRGEPLIELA
jgi:acetyl-CoA/propionyl-CoA carboxylase biotin carboxyl carrier protein